MAFPALRGPCVNKEHLHCFPHASGYTENAHVAMHLSMRIIYFALWKCPWNTTVDSDFLVGYMGIAVSFHALYHRIKLAIEHPRPVSMALYILS